MKKTFVAALAIFLVASAAALSKPAARRNRKGPFVPPTCCTTYTQRPVPLKILEAYGHTSGACPLQAVVFFTVKGRHICADPQATWTQERIHSLNLRRN